MEPPREYPPLKLYRYPHMLPADVAIWERYLDTNPFPTATIAYDVHVGTPVTISPDDPPNIQRMLYQLTTLRIDAVVFLLNETPIIEIKPDAGMSAIGQALAYALLFHKQYPSFPHIVPTILTDTPLPDTPWLCDRLGITLLQTD